VSLSQEGSTAELVFYISAVALGVLLVACVDSVNISSSSPLLVLMLRSISHDNLCHLLSLFRILV